jgi:fatty-acyl-CoA synthase
MDPIDVRRKALLGMRPVWQPQTLDGFLDSAAASYGEQPLVITDDRTLTYGETRRWAAELADGLVTLGVQPGDRVGLLMANHLEFVPLKFAIARAGAVAVPFNYLYRDDELAYVLAQSRCNVLITMQRFGELEYLTALDRIAPGWREGASDRLPDLQTVVVLPDGDPLSPSVLTVEGLTRRGADNPGVARRGTRAPDELGDILYTSGTTGSPKGVMVSHDAVLRTAYASAVTRAFEHGRRIVFSLPCYHMFGYVEGVLAAMVVGGAIVPLLQFSPTDYFSAIERHRASDMLCVPTMTVALLEAPDRADHDLTSLVACLSGAAPAPIWVWDRVVDELGVREVTTGYGMTECGGAMTLTLPEDDLATHSTTVGRPKMAGAAGIAEADGDLVVYRTADPIDGDALPQGEKGELLSTGPTHMMGFWDKPEETGLALRDGWVYSGDLGRVRDDGYLQLTGRSKELYKSGGELVMPKEVEDLLSGHPGVSQAFAVGVPDDRWGEIGCAWVVPEPGSDVTVEELLTLCREHLARFKVPKHLLFIDAADLPTTPTGKIQKYRLAAQAETRLRGAVT